MLISGYDAVRAGVGWFRILHTEADEIVMAFFQCAIVLCNVTYSLQETHC